MRDARGQVERVFALALLVLCAFCSAWLAIDVVALERAGERRRDQLARLAALRVHGNGAANGPVAELDGLFPGYRVVRIVTFAGGAMTLVPQPDSTP